MRKILSLFLLCAFIGCSSARIPIYVQEKRPFTRRFYAEYSRVLAAAKQALADQGWTIEKEMAPQVFEVVSPDENSSENILLVTAIRETHLFLGTHYARMNVYIRSKNDLSEVEVRYMGINDMFLFKPKSFGSREWADQFFARMQVHLGQ